MNRQQLFNEFRVAQLAIQAATGNCGFLQLDGIDQIIIPNSYLYIIEVNLIRDEIIVNYCTDRNFTMPLITLSDSVIDMIVTTMKRKALELADKLTSKEDI